MREHQIVITLKPEQFLQVQKLARSAGAKSMGMFVRQQLLAALGIEGSAQGKPDGSELDLEPIKTELKRLHAELREFVSESSYATEFTIDAEAAMAMLVQAQPGLPFAAEDPSVDSQPVANDYQYDELEATAEKTFAISPRLGAYDLNDSSLSDSLPPLMEPAPSETLEEARAEDKPAEDTQLPPPKPAAKDTEQGFDGSFFFQQKPVSKSTPWVFSAAAEDASKSASRQDAGKIDDRDTGRDPLSELLGPSDMPQANQPASQSSHDDDDDSFDVPLSILTRRRQLAQMKAIEESAGLSVQNNQQANLNKPVSSVPPPKPDKPDLSEQNQSPDKPAAKAEEKPKPVDTQRSSGAFPVYNPLENPDDDTPFSGGPPPKKRQ